MALPKLEKRMLCAVSGAEALGSMLRVRFAPLGGRADEIEDLIELGPRGSLAGIRGVGRVLRILRAGRMRIPRDPYRVGDDLAATVELVQRCAGAVVALTLARRFERTLTVWTEAGVERIHGVIDYAEESDGLTVRRRGGRDVLVIPRDTLIRFSGASTEYFEVLSVDLPSRSCLR